jgi:hypothetical protein
MAADAPTESAVSTVHLYLADGFANDHVVVKVDGRTVFDEQGVTTKKLYGLAKQVGPVTVPQDRVNLEIALPEKGLSTVIDADLNRGSHIPISVEDGRLAYSLQKQIGFM